MHRPPSEAAALERARWLAELGETIVQAQRVAWRLGSERDSEEARELYARLEAARLEVESLRFGDWARPRTEVDPNWIENLLGGNAPLAKQRGG